VLAKHCADAGRDPSTINKTWLCSAIVGSTRAEAEAARDGALAARGVDWSTLNEEFRTAMSARILVGSPEELAAEINGIMAAGLDGIILNFPGNGADADAVAAAGRAIRASLRV
jgi:alkanesulfonate monooxygenase SsuD/methylene tetrahydromethanopterin reductase-like flavin-dependent oxidoreductase (luciferase family)